MNLIRKGMAKQLPAAKFMFLRTLRSNLVIERTTGLVCDALDKVYEI